MKYQSLINQMSLEEKASLMSGKNYWHTKGIQRLNIPSLLITDGPHGVRKQTGRPDNLGMHKSIPATCFPTASTLANSWDKELAYKMGKNLGKEAKSQQVSVILSPALNIKRNPLGGRNFEYFSEDPYLAGEMASQMVQGIQSNGISACPKHFAVNSQETMRMTINEIVDERALHEIYLKAFKKTVQQGKPKTLMSSYNRVNGSYSNENTDIMNSILRNEWGYKGVTVTDWGGNNNRVKGLKAHNQLEMPSSGGITNKQIVQAVLNGEIEEKLLDEAVDTLLNLVFNVALTEDDASSVVVNYLQHHFNAIDAAQKSMVLLKNENNILPLKPKTKVAIIGEFAKKPCFQGGGSSLVNPYYTNNALDILSFSDIEVVGYAQGFLRMGKQSERRVHEAISLARKADVVLLFLGLDESNEAEGVDRPNLKLNENQLNLVEKLRLAKKDTVVILSGGGPIEMPFANHVQGILHTYLAGQGSAQALCNILLGRYNPSAKLSETLPIAYSDIPTKDYYPGKQKTAEHRESIFVGYRYFDSAHIPVQFPFGFGLSYTQFSYDNIHILKNTLSFTLTNIGKIAGAEVIQIYFEKVDSSIFRAKKELLYFEKVFLQPNESKKISFTFKKDDFAFYSIKDKQWKVEDGNYKLQVGRSSQHIELEKTITIKGIKETNEYLTKEYPNYAAANVAHIPNIEFEKLLGYIPSTPFWDKTQPLTPEDALMQMKYKNCLGKNLYSFVMGAHNLLKALNQPLMANNILFILSMRFNQISGFTDQRIKEKWVDYFIHLLNK